jgi:hypothetical protein
MFSNTLMILLSLCFAFAQSKICTTDDTLQLMDKDHSVIFKVDRESKNTTLKNLVADKCECGGSDIRREIAELRQNLTGEIDALKRRLQPPFQTEWVYGTESGVLTSIFNTTACPPDFRLVSCTAPGGPSCISGNGIVATAVAINDTYEYCSCWCTGSATRTWSAYECRGICVAL